MFFHSLTICPVFNTSLGTLQMLMNDKIMFDRYYCINEENVGAHYFIALSHFLTCAFFHKHP